MKVRDDLPIILKDEIASGGVLEIETSVMSLAGLLVIIALVGWSFPCVIGIRQMTSAGFPGAAMPRLAVAMAIEVALLLVSIWYILGRCRLVVGRRDGAKIFHIGCLKRTKRFAIEEGARLSVSWTGWTNNGANHEYGVRLRNPSAKKDIWLYRQYNLEACCFVCDAICRNRSDILRDDCFEDTEERAELLSAPAPRGVTVERDDATGRMTIRYRSWHGLWQAMLTLGNGKGRYTSGLFLMGVPKDFYYTDGTKVSICDTSWMCLGRRLRGIRLRTQGMEDVRDLCVNFRDDALAYIAELMRREFSMKTFARIVLVSFLALAGNGCVYTSSGGAPDFDRCGGRQNVFLAPIWDDSDKAFRLDFPAYSYYRRSGVYPPGTKLTPGGAHWGNAGDIIEGLAHLPTFWLERALSANRTTDYDVVFLDRNSTRGEITLMTFPKHRYDDRLLRQEPFRRYWTNEVFGIDFAEGERTLSENRPGIAASNKRMAYRDKLADAQPVLWWKDESGIEHLLVFQCLRNPPRVRHSLGGGYCVGTPREYKLLYFRDFGFVRAFDFEKKERWLYTSQFDFSTMDGRFVNIGFNGHPIGDRCDWMFCQIDLETGDIRKVGSYTALDKSEVNGGLEIRTTVRPER